VPAPDATVTVVVVTWQGAHLIGPCLDALLAQESEHGVEVVVVDNGSTDGTAELLARDHPTVRVLQSGANLGFAGGCNVALSQVVTPYSVLLNNDARPEPGWLDALLTPFAQPDVASVSSKVLFEDSGLLNSAGALLWADGYGADRGLRDDPALYDEPVDLLVLSGTAVALRTAALDQVGLLDGRLFLYYEDTDLGWRLRLAGWRNVYAPAAVVRHLHAATTGEQSPLFRFYNERNRLLVLVKDATAGRALRAVLRYLLTTLAAVARRDLSMLPLRLRVLRSFAALLPHALRERRRIGRTAAVPRRSLEAELLPVRLRRPDGGLVPPGR
jgi:N-acetylglucosaminyl-diphospho-decaprenol L-rhamnosyltransferase